MPNYTYAREWLDLAGKNLDTAMLLFREKHYTDIIAIEIHQTIEKSLKSIFAYHGIKVPKTHDIPELIDPLKKFLRIVHIDMEDLLEISDYHDAERYPGPRYYLPSEKEIEKNLFIAEDIHKQAAELIKPD